MNDRKFAPLVTGAR